MSRHLTLQPHLGLDELAGRYRKAKDAVERSRFQIIWLLVQGRKTAEVAAVTGYTPTWIYELVCRYNTGGAAGLGDRRRHNPGHGGLLTPEQRQSLRTALQGPAPDGGLWTGQKVADWMAARLGRPVHFQRGCEYLRRLGLTPQRPRPRHAEADPAEQAAFKKTCRTTSRRSAKPIRTPRSSSGPKTSIGSG